MNRARRNQAEDTQGTHEGGNRAEDGPLYRHIRVSSKGQSRSHPRALAPLKTGPEFYTAKGQRLKPTNRSLPIDILGKPGHALVLRDAGPRRKKELEQMAPDKPSDSASPMSLAKIYASTQVDVPSSAEVLQNIHELQPAEPVLSRRKFEALKKTLYKGFTKTQLAAYIHRSSVMAKNKDKITQVRPWVLEKWPWTPEVDTYWGTADALLQGYVSKTTPPKERLATALMRQCWGLGIQELQSQQGYLDVKVQDLQFDLLMLGNRRWLESISKSLFEPGTQIELIRSEKVVRIVAPKVTAELILQEINALLDQAHTRLLDATQIGPRRLDQSVLDEVGKITNTVVRYDKSGKNIQVSWITSPENQREGLEDLADVTYRLLYSAYSHKQLGDATTEVQPEQYEVGGWYLPDYHSKGKLAWKDRLAEWARWTVAIPRRGVMPTVPIKILSDDLPCRNLDTTPSRSFAPDGWSSEPQVTTKAVFGHVLHREPEPNLKDSLRGEISKANLDRHLDRTLSPIIPPLKSLAALTANSEATATQTSILLHFLPTLANSSLPSLELTLLTDPDTNTVTPHSLRATSRVATHDILLPSHAVDIRLTNTTSHLLPGSSVPSACPELMTFLSSSDLRPQEGILSTPPRPPPFRLPSRILSSPPTSDSSTEASYIFTGLELHRHVSTSVEGWKLSYTSIEAGQGGGRRAELALEGIRTADDVDERGMPLTAFDKFERGVGQGGEKTSALPSVAEGQRGAEHYIETLSGLAFGREFSWFGEMPERERGDGDALEGRGPGRDGEI
ncbi:hypothetical protein CONLIGDRAFT_574312 [Coniochaeta ligniaria NRRL 30616]|uniref:Uncharacterized protein n=1 Tax=Coniochaeta ligniaria NRRL 30616 TaxID=1408157 RepID=A0A1J7JRV0_9PEZI|nr:hypothetical protein CONLIGDRAFT_574312 [Coniochaeta ligniaria NRRL 30616]